MKPTALLRHVKIRKQHLRPHAIVGYGNKISLPSPPSYVTRSPGRNLMHSRPQSRSALATSCAEAFENKSETSNRRKILAVTTQLKQLRKERVKKIYIYSGLNGIRTHDLCDGGAVLYQLSYQANWELVIL